MRRSWLPLSLLVSLVVGCHAHIILPGREDEYSAVSGCSGGVCMPTHPLEIFVGARANQEVHVTLVNPHGDDEECDVREDGDRQIATCSYRVVRGFSAPYYFMITVSPARDAAAASCSLDPARMLIHRLDRYVRFGIERTQAVEDGPCIYVAREQPVPST